jgi:hypothetical protein
MLIAEAMQYGEGKMSMVTSIRPQVQAAAPSHRPEPTIRAMPVDTARPVSATDRKNAPAQAAAATAALTARLAERDESRHPAAEARIAAEAAREAYIKASLAAGISPLPLP